MKPVSERTSQARLKLTITAAAETIVRGGHPWVYSDSVRSQSREAQAGELAVIYDRKDKFLAVGLFDPESPLRVRVLHAGKPATLDDAWWQARLETTLARRASVADALTNGLRLINGESDGWPGLVLDRYDTTLVLKLYTAAWLPWLERVLADNPHRWTVVTFHHPIYSPAKNRDNKDLRVFLRSL